MPLGEAENSDVPLVGGADGDAGNRDLPTVGGTDGDMVNRAGEPPPLVPAGADGDTEKIEEPNPPPAEGDSAVVLGEVGNNVVLAVEDIAVAVAAKREDEDS